MFKLAMKSNSLNMLHNKFTKRLGELTRTFNLKWDDPQFFYNQFKVMPIRRIMSANKHFKIKGYSFENVFVIMLTMVLTGEKSIHSLLKSHWGNYIQAHKDVFYRLKNNNNVDWRKILLSFSNGFKRVTEDKSTMEKRIRCLIFDDTLIEKTSPGIEGIGRVYDHVSKRHVIGFKMLAMAFWDGVSLIPLDFSFHREKGKNLLKPFGLKKKEIRNQHKTQRSKISFGHLRFEELDTTKISSMLRMLKDAIRNGFIPDYVLTDSWFTCEELIKAVIGIKKQKVHLIGMYKSATAKFEFNTKHINIAQIRSTLTKPKRYRKANFYYHEVSVLYKGVPLKLFFSRCGTNGKWKTLLTTDTSLSFSKMIELYQTRWTIEVMFKECKQMLKLGKCQSSAFGAHIAETTICLIQYIILGLKHRFEVYESKGEMFNELHRQTRELALNERLWGLLIELLKFVEELFDVEENELMKKILTDDRAYERLESILPNLKNAA